MRCLICEEELKPLTENQDDLDTGQAWGGNVFVCRGAFGSTVFDPPGWETADGAGRYLRVTICDECLVAKAANNMIKVVTVTQREPLFDVETWTPAGHA